MTAVTIRHGSCKILVAPNNIQCIVNNTENLNFLIANLHEKCVTHKPLKALPRKRCFILLCVAGLWALTALHFNLTNINAINCSMVQRTYLRNKYISLTYTMDLRRLGMRLLDGSVWLDVVHLSRQNPYSFNVNCIYAFYSFSMHKSRSYNSS